MATIPTFEPERIYAGDSATWKRFFADYKPGDGWTLHYSFRRRGGDGTAINFDTTASGDSHLTVLAGTDTEDWLPGDYDGGAYVDNSGGERHTVLRKAIQILPNVSDLPDSYDSRSRARRILEFIETSWEKVSKKQTVRTSIEGVALEFRSMDDLIKARNYWQQIVNVEDAIENNRQRPQLLARFTQP